jgi:hypothetical protein
MKWQQKNKYAIVLKEFPHSQIEKWNGSKGYPIMTADNIGVLNEETGNYDFKTVKCHIYGNDVTPCFIGEFVLNMPHIFKTTDSFIDMPHDQHEKEITERFEVRLLKAKSHIDISMAKMYYNTAQIKRLQIKATIMNSNKLPITET